MGILNAGIMGAMYGKLGGMIGSNWKGINTLREYKIPANPQSVAQTAQRTKFAVVVALAQALLASLIVSFWNPFAVKMSGFNAFIKSIFPNVTSAGLITAACKVTAGTLEVPGLTTASYDTADGTTEIYWDGASLGNGLDTDNIGLLVLKNTDNSVVFYDPTLAVRNADTATATLPTGLDATSLCAFIFAHRGTGSSFVVSDSSGRVMAEL